MRGGYSDNPHCKDVVLVKKKTGDRIDFRVLYVCECESCGKEFKKYISQSHLDDRNSVICPECEKEKKKEYHAERTRLKNLEEKKICSKQIRKYQQVLLQNIKQCENVLCAGYESIKQVANTTLNTYLKEVKDDTL